jgi:serine/threonine protein kinase
MSPATELPSLMVGRYHVEKLLGRGGMAVVFAVQDNVRGRRVALKRMLPPADPSKRGRNSELFERSELTLCAEATHAT